MGEWSIVCRSRATLRRDTGVTFALARYKPDGSLDAMFDGDGRVTTDFLNNDDTAFAVAI